MDEADIGQAIEMAFRELAIAQICNAIESGAAIKSDSIFGLGRTVEVDNESVMEDRNVLGNALRFTLLVPFEKFSLTVGNLTDETLESFGIQEHFSSS